MRWLILAIGLIAAALSAADAQVGLPAGVPQLNPSHGGSVPFVLNGEAFAFNSNNAMAFNSLNAFAGD